MIFNHTYSLGDIVEFAVTTRDCPKDSIGDKYLKMSNNTPRKLKILQKIVNDYDKNINHISSPHEVVMHLRVGNVVEHDIRSVDKLLLKPCIAKGKKLSKQIYVYPLEYHLLLQKAYKKKNLNKLTIICGGHMCVETRKSKEYINKIKKSWVNNGYEVKVLITNNADNDFVYMCRSKYFIPSGGGFSMKIQNIRELNGINKDDYNFGRGSNINLYNQLIKRIKKTIQ